MKKDKNFTSNLNNAKNSYAVRDWLNERITDAALKSTEAHIRKFIKDNTEWFASNGLTGPSMTYGNDRQKALMNNYGLDMDEYHAFAKTNVVLGSGFENVSDELQVLLTYSYYRTKKDIFLFFLFFKIYTSRLAKYYKNGINKQRMAAVLENLPSSFDFKRYSSILEVLEKKNATAIANVGNREFKKLSDKDLLDVINTYSSRINNMLRFFSRDRFYASDDVMYGLSDVKENQLEFGNNSLVIEGIMTDLKRDFSLGKFDKNAVRISKAPLDVLKTNGDLVFTYIRVSFEDFIGRVGTDITVVKAEWSKYCIAGRKKPEMLNEIILEIQENSGVDKLRDPINTYCLLEIYNRISNIR